jgi:hypothetical protein
MINNFPIIPMVEENEIMIDNNDNSNSNSNNTRKNTQQTNRKRKGRIAMLPSSSSSLMKNIFQVLVCSQLLLLNNILQVQAWGNSGNSDNDGSYSIYGNGYTRDWLYDGSTLSFEVLGCVWGMVYDSEEAGCLEDESEDGTYNWYMMANCRRPQVAYSVYASDSGSSSCGSSTFVGSVRFSLLIFIFCPCVFVFVFYVNWFQFHLQF